MDTHLITRALDAAIERLGVVAEREHPESYNRIWYVLKDVIQNGGYQGKRILDVGCSIGLHAIAAARLGADVHGIDKFTFPESGEANPFQIQHHEFERVQQAWNEEGVKVRMHDLTEPLPYEDNSFDVLVSNAVIEHLHGTHRFILHECLRVLKPGGLLVVSTPNIASHIQPVSATRSSR